jgi:hypothetical protein
MKCTVKLGAILRGGIYGDVELLQVLSGKRVSTS